TASLVNARWGRSMLQLFLEKPGANCTNHSQNCRPAKHIHISKQRRLPQELTIDQSKRAGPCARWTHPVPEKSSDRGCLLLKFGRRWRQVLDEVSLMKCCAADNRRAGNGNADG